MSRVTAISGIIERAKHPQDVALGRNTQLLHYSPRNRTFRATPSRLFRTESYVVRFGTTVALPTRRLRVQVGPSPKMILEVFVDVQVTCSSEPGDAKERLVRYFAAHSQPEADLNLLIDTAIQNHANTLRLSREVNALEDFFSSRSSWTNSVVSAVYNQTGLQSFVSLEPTDDPLQRIERRSVEPLKVHAADCGDEPILLSYNIVLDVDPSNLTAAMSAAPRLPLIDTEIGRCIEEAVRRQKFHAIFSDRYALRELLEAAVANLARELGRVSTHFSFSLTPDLVVPVLEQFSYSEVLRRPDWPSEVGIQHIVRPVISDFGLFRKQRFHDDKTLGVQKWIEGHLHLLAQEVLFGASFATVVERFESDFQAQLKEKLISASKRVGLEVQHYSSSSNSYVLVLSKEGDTVRVTSEFRPIDGSFPIGVEILCSFILVSLADLQPHIGINPETTARAAVEKRIRQAIEEELVSVRLAEVYAPSADSWRKSLKLAVSKLLEEDLGLAVRTFKVTPVDNCLTDRIKYLRSESFSFEVKVHGGFGASVAVLLQGKFKVTGIGQGPTHLATFANRPVRDPAQEAKDIVEFVRDYVRNQTDYALDPSVLLWTDLDTKAKLLERICSNQQNGGLRTAVAFQYGIDIDLYSLERAPSVIDTQLEEIIEAKVKGNKDRVVLEIAADYERERTLLERKRKLEQDGVAQNDDDMRTVDTALAEIRAKRITHLPAHQIVFAALGSTAPKGRELEAPPPMPKVAS